MQITHNHQLRQFETTIDGKTAFLSYQVITPDTLNYHHTFVPSELGGRGIGSKLVQFALDYADNSKQKIIPSCSFVAAYIDKHSHYQHLMA